MSVQKVDGVSVHVSAQSLHMHIVNLTSYCTLVLEPQNVSSVLHNLPRSAKIKPNAHPTQVRSQVRSPDNLKLQF